MRACRFFGLGGVLLTAGGCFMGMYFPTSMDIELAVKTPLRGPATDTRTIAIVLPSSLEEQFSLPDASRGKLDQVGLAMGERLQQSGRFTIVSQTQYQAALSAQRRMAPSQAGSPMSDRDRTESILNAARLVKADGVLLFDGSWESAANLGTVSFGRPEYRRLLTLTLLEAHSGQTIWYQEATVVIHEGIAVPQEPAIREALVADVTDNFLRTLR
ncbi:MAG: hypothetical protein EPO61_02570 [Nitrospirae bacterium]|nr:MAG: hypothetical protein EPO61_02570 [Nitrospirota bacterium]